MALESDLSDLVRERLSPYGVVKRVENAVDLGTPDSVYCLRVPARPVATGWLELKQLPTWPVRADWRVVVPHLTLDQVRWLEGWTRAGGRADLLLKVARDYLLLDAPAVAALYRRELTRDQLCQSARVMGSWRLPVRELVSWLTRVDPARV